MNRAATKERTSSNWDATKRLETAVALAELNLETPRGRELMKLKDAVRYFLWPSVDRRRTGGVWLTDALEHDSITAEVLLNITQGAWRLLGDTVSDRDEQRINKRRDGTGSPPQKPTLFKNLRLRLVADSDGSCYEELVADEETSIEERFLYILLRLLIQEGLGSKICSCPECGKLFVRRRRQKRCSRRCTNKANKRAHFERKRLKERDSATRRRVGNVSRKKK